MSRSRDASSKYASAHPQPTVPVAGYPGDSAASAGDGAPPSGSGWRSSLTPGLSSFLVGVGLCVVVFVLGAIVKISAVSKMDLSIDRHIAIYDRSPALNTIGKFFTTIGKPETAGVAMMFLIPIILLLVGRRLDALKVFCIFGGAFAVALAGKYIINEHRPPASIQLVRVGTGHSFPSGHATSATVIAIVLIGIVATTLAWRWVAGVIGVIYALGVIASRVYLADHYLLDVIGSMLCAIAAWYVVTGLAAMPVVQPYLRKFKVIR